MPNVDIIAMYCVVGFWCVYGICILSITVLWACGFFKYDIPEDSDKVQINSNIKIFDRDGNELEVRVQPPHYSNRLQNINFHA